MEMSTDGSSLVLTSHSLNMSLVNSPCVIRWLHLMVSYYSNHAHMMMLLTQQRGIMSFTLRRRVARRRAKRRISQLLHQLRLRRKKRKRRLKIMMIMKRKMIFLNSQSKRIHMLTCLRGK